MPNFAPVATFAVVPIRTIFIAGALLATTLFTTACTQQTTNQPLPANGSTAVHISPSQQIELELATSADQRTRGLMYRSALAENSGMLFVYPQPGNYAIWMKNMQFPLDLIFISERQRVVHIADNVPPCRQSPCPIYRSEQPVKYILEVNAGYAKHHHIQVGTLIPLPTL